jgi:hypothetical protein
MVHWGFRGHLARCSRWLSGNSEFLNTIKELTSMYCKVLR